MTLAKCLIFAGAIASAAFIAGARGQTSLAGPAEPDVSTKSVPSRYEPERLPLPTTRKLSEVEKTYLDAYNILKQDNACSRFFGGPGAIEALNQLTLQIRPAYLDRHIGMRMTGETTSVQNFNTGFRYRLFDKAEVNINGSFFQMNGLAGAPTIPLVGSFPPNSREARVTLLLHELGHLIPESDGPWVLRDDGNDAWRSRQNTQRVIGVCGKQIRELHQFSFDEALQPELNARSQSVLTESPDA